MHGIAAALAIFFVTLVVSRGTGTNHRPWAG